MTIDQLLAALAERKVTLFLKEDGLRYRAPKGALTVELRAAIAGHRPALVELLRRELRDREDKETPKCEFCDPRHWVDQPTGKGQIRTICGKCGYFKGYRPAGG